jgi:hypothetical protein
MSNELSKLVEREESELTEEMAIAFVRETAKPALEAFSA